MHAKFQQYLLLLDLLFHGQDADKAMMTINGYIPQTDYLQVLRLVPIVCVDVAILQGDMVLLVKRKDKPAQDQWWFPGGRVRKGESLQQAAIRKAKEEVGLTCEVGEIIHTAETIFDDGPEGIAVHSVNTVFALSLACDGRVMLDDHHLVYQWAEADWVKDNSSELHSYMVEGLAKVFSPKINHYDNLRKILYADTWDEDIAYFARLYHEHFVEGKEIDYLDKSAMGEILRVIK